MPAESLDLSGLLSAWQLPAPDVAESASSAAVSFAARAGVPSRVVSSRFGMLTLECSQQDAVRLLPLLPELSQAVSEASSGHLRVRLLPSASFRKDDDV